MKTLALTFILTALLSTGTAFAAEKHENHCQTPCTADCSSHTQRSQENSTTHPSQENISPLSYLYDVSGD